jgi:hypothetical protein
MQGVIRIQEQCYNCLEYGLATKIIILSREVTLNAIWIGDWIY